MFLEPSLVNEREPSLSLQCKWILPPTLEHPKDSSISICVHLKTFRSSRVKGCRICLQTWAIIALHLLTACVSLSTSPDFSVTHFSFCSTYFTAFFRGWIQSIHGTKLTRMVTITVVFSWLLSCGEKVGPALGGANLRKEGIPLESTGFPNKRDETQRGWVGHPWNQRGKLPPESRALCTGHDWPSLVGKFLMAPGSSVLHGLLPFFVSFSFTIGISWHLWDS